MVLIRALYLFFDTADYPEGVQKSFQHGICRRGFVDSVSHSAGGRMAVLIQLFISLSLFPAWNYIEKAHPPLNYRNKTPFRAAVKHLLAGRRSFICATQGGYRRPLLLERLIRIAQALLGICIAACLTRVIRYKPLTACFKLLGQYSLELYLFNG